MALASVWACWCPCSRAGYIPSRKDSDLSNFRHLPPVMARLAADLLKVWLQLARRLEAEVRSPLSPCCGPSCSAPSAAQACSKCQVARFHGIDCVRCVDDQSTLLTVQRGVADTQAAVQGVQGRGLTSTLSAVVGGERDHLEA